MSELFANLGLQDTDYVLAGTQGQGLVYEAVTEYLARLNGELAMQMRFLVEEVTENYTDRYYLPGNGYMQERDTSGEGVQGSVKAHGEWDVAYPLKDFTDQITANDVVAAYTTVASLRRSVESIGTRYANTMRREMLRALMLRSNVSWLDPLHSTLTVRKLANTDGTLYPPVIGSMTEADDEHYAESGFLYSAIDATHDPWSGTGMTGSFGIIPELEEHFGPGAGSSEIVSFINKQEVPYVTASGFTKFVPVEITQIREGAATAVSRSVPQGIPETAVILGRHRDGAWIVRWDFIPAGYILSVHNGAPKPLRMRVDPAATGLGRGLQLVARDQQFPMTNSVWRARFGFGVGNRLNGVVVELGNGGSYTDPTIV